MEARSADVKLNFSGELSDGRECAEVSWGAVLKTMCPQQQKQSSQLSRDFQNVARESHNVGTKRSMPNKSTAANNNSSSATQRTTL